LVLIPSWTLTNWRLLSISISIALNINTQATCVEKKEAFTNTTYLSIYWYDNKLLKQ